MWFGVVRSCFLCLKWLFKESAAFHAQFFAAYGNERYLRKQQETCPIYMALHAIGLEKNRRHPQQGNPQGKYRQIVVAFSKTNDCFSAMRRAASGGP